MSNDQASGLRHLNEPVKVLAVTAGKGGVGKTNISVNLALAMAKEGKRILLFDADLGLANIDIMLGLHAKKNISHVVSGECTLEEILIDVSVLIFAAALVCIFSIH